MGVGVCAGCGKQVNSAWTACPECGADPATGRAAHLNADLERVNFPRAHYLGGLRRFPQPLQGELVFTQSAITIAGPQDAHLLAMADVESVELLNSLPAEQAVSGGTRAGVAAVGALTLGVGGIAMAVAATTPDRFNRLTFGVHARQEGEPRRGRVRGRRPLPEPLPRPPYAPARGRRRDPRGGARRSPGTTASGGSAVASVAGMCEFKFELQH